MKDTRGIGSVFSLLIRACDIIGPKPNKNPTMAQIFQRGRRERNVNFLALYGNLFSEYFFVCKLIMWVFFVCKLSCMACMLYPVGIVFAS